MSETVWEFKTDKFKVSLEIEPEYDLDLSWDDDGSVREGLETGQYIAFVAKVAVYWQGLELGSSYLGQCIYEDAASFRDHIGSKPKGYGSYFSDMVREAIAEARRTISVFPHIRKVSQ